MSLSEQAERIFNRLPEDGTTVGGITLQRELELSKLEYQRARDELKTEGLAVAGRGRGGSLGRIKGAAPKEEKIVTKAERMAYARAAKAAKSREEREMADLIERVLTWIHNHGYTQVEKKDLSYYEGRFLFTVWDNWDGEYYGKTMSIPQLEYDQLRASYIGG